MVDLPHLQDWVVAPWHEQQHHEAKDLERNDPEQPKANLPTAQEQLLIDLVEAKPKERNLHDLLALPHHLEAPKH